MVTPQDTPAENTDQRREQLFQATEKSPSGSIQGNAFANLVIQVQRTFREEFDRGERTLSARQLAASDRDREISSASKRLATAFVKSRAQQERSRVREIAPGVFQTETGEIRRRTGRTIIAAPESAAEPITFVKARESGEEAVSAGRLTQEQADDLLEELVAGGFAEPSQVPALLEQKQRVLAEARTKLEAGEDTAEFDREIQRLDAAIIKEQGGTISPEVDVRRAAPPLVTEPAADEVTARAADFVEQEPDDAFGASPLDALGQVLPAVRAEEIDDAFGAAPQDISGLAVEARRRVVDAVFQTDTLLAARINQGQAINLGDAIQKGANPVDLALMGFQDEDINAARDVASALAATIVFTDSRGIDIVAARRSGPRQVSAETLQTLGISPDVIAQAEAAIARGFQAIRTEDIPEPPGGSPQLQEGPSADEIARAFASIRSGLSESAPGVVQDLDAGRGIDPAIVLNANFRLREDLLTLFGEDAVQEAEGRLGELDIQRARQEFLGEAPTALPRPVPEPVLRDGELVSGAFEVPEDIAATQEEAREKVTDILQFQFSTTTPQFQSFARRSDLIGSAIVAGEAGNVTWDQVRAFIEGVPAEVTPADLVAGRRTLGTILQTGGALAFPVAIAGSALTFKEDTSTQRALNIGLDVVSLIPVGAVAIGSARSAGALTGTARASRIATDVFIAELFGPIDAVRRPIQALRAGIYNPIEAVIAPRRVVGQEVITSTLRAPAAPGAGGPGVISAPTETLAELRSGAVSASEVKEAVNEASLAVMQRAESIEVPLGNGNSTLQLNLPSAQFTTGPGAFTATPDGRNIMAGNFIVSGNEGGLFFAPTPLSRFADATSTGKTFPLSPEAQALVDAGKLSDEPIPTVVWLRDQALLDQLTGPTMLPGGGRGVVPGTPGEIPKIFDRKAEFEALLPNGVTLPEPSQILFQRGLGGQRYAIAVIGEPLTPRQLAGLKLSGAQQAVANIFTPPAVIRFGGADEIADLINRSDDLIEQAASAKLAGNAELAEQLTSEATEIRKGLSTLQASVADTSAGLLRSNADELAQYADDLANLDDALRAAGRTDDAADALLRSSTARRAAAESLEAASRVAAGATPVKIGRIAGRSAVAPSAESQALIRRLQNDPRFSSEPIFGVRLSDLDVSRSSGGVLDRLGSSVAVAERVASPRQTISADQTAPSRQDAPDDDVTRVAPRPEVPRTDTVGRTATPPDQTRIERGEPTPPGDGRIRVPPPPAPGDGRIDRPDIITRTPPPPPPGDGRIDRPDIITRTPPPPPPGDGRIDRPDIITRTPPPPAPGDGRIDRPDIITRTPPPPAPGDGRRAPPPGRFRLPDGTQLPVGLFPEIVSWPQGKFLITRNLLTGQTTHTARKTDGTTARKGFKVLKTSTRRPLNFDLDIGAFIANSQSEVFFRADPTNKPEKKLRSRRGRP